MTFHPVGPKSAKARGGFTLVELLVVIGIIALLISILLPSLNRARRSAKSVQCLSNLRQLANAASGYAAANRGSYQMLTYSIALPGNITEARFLQYSIRTDTFNTTLYELSLRNGILSPYLDVRAFTNLKVFECPEAMDLPHTTLGPAATSQYPIGTPEYDLLTNICYGSNFYLSQPFGASSTAAASMTNKACRIRNSAETIMFADSAVMGLYSPTSVSRYNQLSSPSGTNYAPGGGLVHGRHPNGKSGVAWCDGHATLEAVNSLDRAPASPTVAAARIAQHVGYIEPDPNFVGTGADATASYYYLPTKGVH